MLTLSASAPAVAVGQMIPLRTVPVASGDQFFLLDNSRFYFRDMPDEKHLRYVPNAKHDLEGSDARDGILAWYRAILADRPRPSHPAEN